MTLKLNCGAFESYIVNERELFGGIQYLFRFENNYGASVIKHDGSYGRWHDLWELAVVKFTGESNEEWNLCYETEITDDVIGELDDGDVRDLLDRIRGL